jgi:hypothetical protein
VACFEGNIAKDRNLLHFDRRFGPILSAQGYPTRCSVPMLHQALFMRVPEGQNRQFRPYWGV